ncbi:hypothetical protein SNEBB_007356 [Seison nebaliae]|nr:hypothetical protein SNEBB_007356 [Seison nebaliae]
MAMKRFTSSKIDWTKFEQLVPSSQIKQFHQLKGRHSQYEIQMESLNKELSSIDFKSYEKYVSPEILKSFQQEYSKLTIAYPKDIDNRINEVKKQFEEEFVKAEEFAKGCQKQKNENNEAIAKWTNIPPMEELTCELRDYYFPDNVIPKNDQPMMGPYDEVMEKPELLNKAGGELAVLKDPSLLKKAGFDLPTSS